MSQNKTTAPKWVLPLGDDRSERYVAKGTLVAVIEKCQGGCVVALVQPAPGVQAGTSTHAAIGTRFWLSDDELRQP